MEKEDIKLYNRDCVEVMKEIPSESIDCCIIDPPYHIISGGGTIEERDDEPSGIFNRRSGKNKDRVKQGKLFEHNEIKFSEWLPDLYRIMKSGTHTYIMINARNLKELQEEAEKVGFEFQQLLVWIKDNKILSQYYMNQHELILMLKKGEARPINDCGCSNIIKIDNILGNKMHPTEKPIELMEYLIKNSSNENDTVIDIFMGSGATGVASKKLGRKFIGCEIDEEYFNVAKARIEEGKSRRQIQNPNEQSIFDYI